MFEVGDIVMTKDKEQKKMIPAVVTLVNKNWSVNVMFSDGNFGWRKQEKVKPTGRHIDIYGVFDLIR